MAQQETSDAIRRYLSDAIAAEKNFEDQLRDFVKDTNEPTVQQLFQQHAEETHRQWERLTARLEALGGRASGTKSFLSHILGFAPKMAQVGHDEAEKGAQDLMMAYAVENSEVAMYEALAVSAAAANDRETERLAREIQQEEQMTAQKVWNLIAPMARSAFLKVTGQPVAQAA